MPLIDTLTLTNFGIHRKRTFKFGPGFNVIRGANEAGKTTVLEAIAIAFFGSSALRGGWEDVVTTGEKVSTLSIDLRFGQYTIHRSKASASVVSDDGQVEISGHGDVTDFFLRLFGVEKGTEKHVMVAKQGKIQGILEEGNSDATRFIENLANFDQIDQLVERMKAVYPVVDQQALNQQVAALEEKLTEKKAEELPDLGVSRFTLKTREHSRDKAQNAVDAMVDVLVAQGNELDVLKEQKRSFDAATVDVVNQVAALDKLKVDQKTVADAVRILETEIDCSKGRLASARAFLADLEKKQAAYQNYKRVVNFVGCEHTWDEDLITLYKELEGAKAAVVVLEGEVKVNEKKIATLEATPVAGEQLTALRAKQADISEQKAVLKAMTADSDEVVKLKQSLADVDTEMAVAKSKLIKETVCSACGTDLHEKAEEINMSVSDELVLLNDTRCALEVNLKAAYKEQRDSRSLQEKELDREYNEVLKKTDKLIKVLELAQKQQVDAVKSILGRIQQQIVESKESIDAMESIVATQNNVFALLKEVGEEGVMVDRAVYPWSVSWAGEVPKLPYQDQINRANDDVVYCTGLVTQLDGKKKEFHKCCADLSAAQVKLTQLQQELTKLTDPTTQIEALVVSISDGKVKLVELQTNLNAQIEGVNAAKTKLALDEQVVKKHGEDLAAIKKDIKAVQDRILESAENNAMHRAVAEARTTVIESVWNTLLTAANDCFSAIRGTVSEITRDGKFFRVNGVKTVRLSGSTLDSLGLAMRAAIRDVFCPATDFVLLDEVAAGMDVERTAAAMAQVACLNVPQVVLVTHENVSDSLANHIVEV